MRRCAFLTLAEKGNFVIDDEHAYGPLAELGWQVDAVPWNREGVNWNDFELVVIRSTWDYQSDPDLFLQVLADIEASNARLANPREVVLWNLRKTYLRDLAERGVATVPTAWRDRLRPGELAVLCEELESNELVIKPQVGANADGVFRYTNTAAQEGDQQEEVEAYYADRPLMAQPFVSSIQEQGEYSLFYFNGEYSHAVLKTPKANDFRSQEEHGARIAPVQIDRQLRTSGQQAIDALNDVVLYARADFVRDHASNEYWLMELELIEPSLYLRTDPAAPERFARAVHGLMG